MSAFHVVHSSGSNSLYGTDFVPQNWCVLSQNDKLQSFSSMHELFEKMKKGDKKGDMGSLAVTSVSTLVVNLRKKHKIKAGES